MSRKAGGPLEGLRVLDLTRALAGPFATQVLADLGADVIKVEDLAGGDMSRSAGPFLPEDEEHRHSGYFHSINRDKRAIAVDMKTDAGKEIIRRLVEQSDLLVENFRAGVMEKLGLSYESLRERNRALVYAAVRGFGDPRSGKSPYAEWPAYDVTAQAMGGMMGITGLGAGQPMKVGPGVGDTVPGLYLAVGALSAVYRAKQTGEGQFVDVAMVDAVLGICERIVYQRSFGNVVPHPEGNHHPFLVPFGVFPASDGHISLACPNVQFFRDLCEILGAGDLADKYGSRSKLERNRERVEIIARLSEVTARFSKRELAALLGERVPFAPVYDVDDILEDPHFEARDMIAEIECPGLAAPKKIAGIPIKFSDTPCRVTNGGPEHGRDTFAVLTAAGFSSAQIAAWDLAGAIKCQPAAA